VIRRTAQWLIVFASIGYSQVLPNAREHTLIVHGIHYTLEQEYDSAASCFKMIIKEFPSHPAGYLYLAGLLEARYIDYGDTFDEKRYDSLLLNVTIRSDSLKSKNGSKAWGYFYDGTADAFRSFTASDNGNLPAALYYGLSAAKSLERCLEIDSTFVAAKNVLGSYYYWRSKLSWLPFVSDRRQEGIDLILQTIDHPYERHIAYQNLMLIYIDEKKYTEAEKYGDSILAEYPNNRSFMWNLLTAYEQSGDSIRTEEMTRRLLQSALDAPVVNRYTEATCRLKLAQFAMSRNDRETAKEECERIVVLKKFADDAKGDIDSKIKKAREILSLIAKH